MDQKNDEVPAEQKVVEETTQVAPPTTEAPTVTEEQTATEPESQDEPKGMTEEQRKAFQDQRLEIKRLKEETGTRKQSESAFAAFRPQSQVGAVDVNRYADPTTGIVDWNTYNQAVTQQARVEAAQAAREEVDEYRARQTHPDLFENPRTEKLIAAQWLYEKMQGRNVSITEIANDFSKDFAKAVTKAEKTGAEKMLTQVSEKEQAAVTPSQTSSQASQQLKADDLENLQRQSRGKGRESEEAVAKRFSQIPWK